MTDFRALLHALTEAGVDVILIGGVAATSHGSSRLTRDVDVVYRRTPENIARLVTALTPFQPYFVARLRVSRSDGTARRSRMG